MGAVRETVRSLLRTPGFTLSVVATLGLAIGANASVFTLVDQVVFRPLPVEAPAELVVINAPMLFGRRIVGLPFSVLSSTNVRGEGGVKVKVYGLNYETVLRFRDQVKGFRDVLAFFAPETPATMPAGDRALEVNALLVTGNYFRTLGVRPSLGRFPDGNEGSPEGHAVAVLSHGFWQRQFGGDPGVLDRVIRLNEASLTVVGVGPAGFTGTVSGMRVDAFVPLQMAEAFEEPGIRAMARHGLDVGWDSPVQHRLTAIARLAPGVSRHEAEKMAAVVYDRIKAEEEAQRVRYEQRGSAKLSEALRKRIANARLTLLPAGMAGSQQLGAAHTLDTVLSLLMAMVALVLLVAAGNVANLLVARASARARETSIRLVLGATRWRLLRARLVEALVLALLSGGVGFLLSSWLTALLPAVLGLSEMPPGVSAAPDWRVAVFTAAVSAATGVLVWAVSAVQVTRQASLASPGSSSLSQVRGGHLVLRRAVVVAQVTLSAALLCGAALLTRSLVGLMLVDPGFDMHGIAALTLTRGGQVYEADRARAVIDDFLTQTGGLPGVVSASASSHLPLSGGTDQYWLIADDPGMDRTAPVVVDTVQVSAAYFDTLRLPLVAGREFTTSDRAGGQNVAVLSEALARRLFGTSQAAGRRVTFSRASGTDTAVKFANRDVVFDIEVVGVARDARSHSVRTEPALTIYRPQSQVPSTTLLTVLLRTRGAMPTLREVESLVRRVDPSFAVRNYASLDEVAAAGLGRERVLATLSSAFGALAAALSAMGVLGLTGYLVTRRRREIGVRLALGCTRSRATRLVMREVVWLSAAGALAGGGLYFAASRYLRSELYDLSAADPATLGAAIVLVMLLTVVAAYLPARRAARVDPAVTLRSE
jgi:putative ABC transport system permease protein